MQLIDYYPYGMVASQWVREGEQVTRELFQGKSYEQLSGLSDFHARHYDAALGRWHAVDPANQFASPYTGMGNNPVIGVDPDRKFVHIIIGAVVGGAINWIANGARFDKQGLAYFGVGALAGGLSADIGAGVNVAMAGGSFGACFAGTAAGVASTGFLSGAATGAAAGFTTIPKSGCGCLASQLISLPSRRGTGLFRRGQGMAKRRRFPRLAPGLRRRSLAVTLPPDRAFGCVRLFPGRKFAPGQCGLLFLMNWKPRIT